MKCLLCNQFYNDTYDLIDLLLPKRLFGNYLCPSCKEMFELIKYFPHCSYCLHKGLNCTECQRWQNFTLCHQGLFYYNEIAKQWLHEYKIMGNFNLRYSFLSDIYDCLYPLHKQGYTFVPIPISEEKYYLRGFNQVTAILELLPFNFSECLKQVINEPDQKSKSKVERLQTKQKYQLVDIPSQKICLVDDIYTTGRTLAMGYELFSEITDVKITSFSIFRA